MSDAISSVLSQIRSYQSQVGHALPGGGLGAAGGVGGAGAVGGAAVERLHDGQLPGIRGEGPLLKLALVGFENRRHIRALTTACRARTA